MSDIVIMVLDARDPEGTRVSEIEEKVKTDGKKIIYLLNKQDLVPEENVKGWQKWFKSQSLLCIPFKSNGVLKPEQEESKVQNEASGQDKLMTVLFKYARKFLDKKGQENITVSLVGFPNVGKSSVINVLKNKAVVHSGSSPFITQNIQQVKLNKHVTLVDSPGVLLVNTEGANASQTLRSAIQVEDLISPVLTLEQILPKIDKSEILRHYRIGNYKFTSEMLNLIALKKGLVD